MISSNERLRCRHCVIHRVLVIDVPHDFDLFKFADRGRHGHVVLFVMCFQHLFLEQEVHPVSDDQCCKLDEDLCMQRLIGLAVHGSVTEEGLIFPEQFLGCIPALIEIKGIRCSHLLGCDDDEVPAEGYLLIDDLITFPTIHELFVILAFMIIDQIKVPAEFLPKIQLHSLMLLKEQCHPVDLFFYILSFGSLLPFVIVNVEVALLLIRRIQLLLHGDAVHLVITQAELTLFFEAAFDRQDKVTDQGFHSLHHDDELVTVLIHEVDVFLAEVSSVKDETNLTVSIALCLLQHLLELRDIDDASGILLIVKRLGVVMVIGDRVVQDRLSVVILRMSDLDVLQITCLAVLIGRIIRDIDLFTMIMPVVPRIVFRVIPCLESGILTS